MELKTTQDAKLIVHKLSRDNEGVVDILCAHIETLSKENAELKAKLEAPKSKKP